MHLDAFDVLPNRSLTNQRRFFDFPVTGDPGVPDGVKVDVEGRVFCTGPGGIYVITPAGKQIGVLRFPEQAVNMGWGDADNKALYVGAMTSVYRIRMKTPGTPIPRSP
jgi:gluconolactonase